MPDLDFVPLGLTARWPSRRWLEFLEGPASGPFWGAHLGHASTSAALYVTTYPRVRFSTTMQRAGDDPLQEVAFSLTHTLINRALVQVRIGGTRRGILTRLLTQYSASQAAAYRSWRTIDWRVEGPPAADSQIPVRTVSLAGWQAAFSVTADSYIAAYSYGIALDGIKLTPVHDPRTYGFTFEDAVLPANASPAAPGNNESEELHPDLARMLEGA